MRSALKAQSEKSFRSLMSVAH